MDFTRITADSTRMGGVPCIRHLRIPVASAVEMVADGMTTAGIVSACPDLEAEALEIGVSGSCSARILAPQVNLASDAPT